MTENPAQPLTYEAARDRLVAVVRELESGNVPLSKSMELWQEGERLAATCQRWLDGARETIRRAQAGDAAAADTSEPADSEDDPDPDEDAL